MARWLVKLEGDQFDIEEFPRCFPDGDMYAIAEGDGVFITGPGLERLKEASEVLEAATQALDTFFAVVLLLLPDQRKPSVGVIYREDDAGRRQGYVFASAHAVGRAKVRAIATTNGGTAANPGPTPAQQLLRASHLSTHLQIATLLWADPLRTWPRLYRITEELERELGAPLNRAGLCTDEERERFRRSANTAEIAGKDSRHASGKFEPPTKPMSLDEASAFVRRLLVAILQRMVN